MMSLHLGPGMVVIRLLIWQMLCFNIKLKLLINPIYSWSTAIMLLIISTSLEVRDLTPSIRLSKTILQPPLVQLRSTSQILLSYKHLAIMMLNSTTKLLMKTKKTISLASSMISGSLKCLETPLQLLTRAFKNPSWPVGITGMMSMKTSLCQSSMHSTLMTKMRRNIRIQREIRCLIGLS